MRRFRQTFIPLTLGVMLLAVHANAQTTGDASVIQVPGRVNTDQETVEVSGQVTALGLVALTADGKSVTVAADGSFRLRRRVPVGKSTIILIAKDDGGNVIDEQRVYVRRTGIADVAGAYHALVIGNNAYRDLMNLETAVNDADEVSTLLREQYGFEVTTLFDATRYDIVTALNELRSTLTEKDNFLIYYAGHGDLDVATDRGYWLPIDAERNSSANWISVVTVTDAIKAMSAKHVLVVADSCYSGTLTRAPETELRVGAERMAWLKRVAAKRACRGSKVFTNPEDAGKMPEEGG